MCSTILKKNKQEIILLNDNVFAIKKNILVHKFVTFHYSGNGGINHRSSSYLAYHFEKKAKDIPSIYLTLK